MTLVPVRSNVEQVERLLSALSAGDDATVLGLVDPAVELVPLVVAAGLMPDAYHGLDGIHAYLEDADAVDVERGFVATRVRGAQDTVVAFGDLPAGTAGDTMPAAVDLALARGPGHARDAGVRRGRHASRASGARGRRAGPPRPAACAVRAARERRRRAPRGGPLGPEPEAHRAGAQRCPARGLRGRHQRRSGTRTPAAGTAPPSASMPRSATVGSGSSWPMTVSGWAPAQRIPASAWACPCSARWPTR